MTWTWILALLLCLPAFPQAVRSVDPARSTLTVHVGKAGLFSAFGHGHEIAAPVFSGSVRGQEAVEFVVDARALRVADADVSDQDRAEIQRTMLGRDVLDVARYPEIRFHSTAVEAVRPGEWRVRGGLTLHGQTRPITVTVKQAGARYLGVAVFKQTEFGIQPVRAAGGSVRVKDELRVELQIALR